MQLEGLVEDVHLEEVLRVLAVSGRSGTLHTEGPEGAGLLTLVSGRVVAARVDGDRTTVEEALAAGGAVDLPSLQELPAHQRQKPVPECLQELMVVAPELPEEADRVLEARLRTLVARLMRLSRGTFHFTDGGNLAPPCFLGDQGAALARGVSAEELAEKARDARAHGAPAEPGAKPVAPSDNADLLVVDNDAALLAEVTARVTQRGLRVRGVASALEGFAALGSLGHAVGVVDLVMPRMDGRGILGGLDLIRRVKEKEPHRRVILTMEVDNPDAELRARELGVAAVVRRPPRGQAGPADMVTFLDAVLAAAGFNEKAGSVDLAQELLAEMGESSSAGAGPAGSPQSMLARNLELLRDMVGPVNDPERRDEIPLMILRVASSTFSRAALFLVAENALVGLGGFGLDANGRDPGKALRDTHIPLDADTVLATVLKDRRSQRRPFFASEWNRYLSDRLGGPTPSECYVAPVFCNRAVEAVLYCDNALDGHPLGDTQVLELFLLQAGAAMERASLERRLMAEMGQVGLP
jgi:DNA-binding NarL/FixJ family response regulator